MRKMLDSGNAERKVTFKAWAEARSRPTGFGDTDDGSRQGFVFDHALQRGKDFLVCQVARRAKEHEGIGRNGIGRELELSCTARLITGCHRLDLLTPHILLLTLYSFL